MIPPRSSASTVILRPLECSNHTVDDEATYGELNISLLVFVSCAMSLHDFTGSFDTDLSASKYICMHNLNSKRLSEGQDVNST